MNYEKKHKEEIVRATQLWENGDITREQLEYIFPEYKEESEDEKIKRILHSISSKISSHLRDIFTDEEFQCFDAWSNAWLEKQEHDGKKWIYEDVYLKEREQLYQDGVDDVLENPHKYGLKKQDEQKPIDNVEPKFHEGDWVVDKNGVVQQILSYKNGIYKHTNGYSAKMFEDEWRLWDITKDAKDGDVLATDDGNICIFDGTVKDGKYPFAYCGLTRHRFEFYDSRLPFTHNNIYPATKEQYDTLMKAMTNAGYSFDFDKKELKKIEDKPLVIDEGKAEIDYCFTKMMNNEKVSPTWSDDDEYILEAITYTINHSGYSECIGISTEVMINWLNSLKDRVKHQWKPSEEQMKQLKSSADIYPDSRLGHALKSLYQDLKKLRKE